MLTNPDIPHSPRLLEQVVDRMRVKHYSLRTEKTYVGWIKRFIWFHGKRHPKEMGASEVEAFLSHLAVDRSVSASTQNQAKSALLFLYKEVLQIQLPWLDKITQAKVSKRLPVVLTRTEVQSVLSRLDGTVWLIASLLYGSGMRIMHRSYGVRSRYVAYGPTLHSRVAAQKRAASHLNVNCQWPQLLDSCRSSLDNERLQWPS